MSFFGAGHGVPGFSRFSQNITENIVDVARDVDRFAQRDGQKVGAALTTSLEGVETVGKKVSGAAGAVLPIKFFGDALASGARTGLYVQGALKELDTEGRYSQTGTRGAGLEKAKEYAPKIAQEAALTSANIEAAAASSALFL
tara:strand:+ start:1534 stop:1962 length:429 start_codon:yes stop_codon:yes gene_type:complete